MGLLEGSFLGDKRRALAIEVLQKGRAEEGASGVVFILSKIQAFLHVYREMLASSHHSSVIATTP
jgi:hypothetical protein